MLEYSNLVQIYMLLMGLLYRGIKTGLNAFTFLFIYPFKI